MGQELLGRHVFGRAEHRALLRDFLILFRQARDAKIENLGQLATGFAARNEDVAGLDVAMQDAPIVRGAERVTQLHADVHRVRDADPRPHRQDPFQRAALEQFHHQVRSAVLGLARIQAEHDPRMPRDGQRACLEQQALTRLGRLQLVFEQQFDRDGATRIKVLGFEHRPRATACNLALQAIAPIDHRAHVELRSAW